jgi:hypothetical protein
MSNIPILPKRLIEERFTQLERIIYEILLEENKPKKTVKGPCLPSSGDSNKNREVDNITKLV